MSDTFQTKPTKTSPGCECCCDTTFDTACMTLDIPDDAPFDQALGTNAWSITTGFLPMCPGQGSLICPTIPGAFHLTGNYYNSGTGTVVCYHFVILLGFRWDVDCKLVLQVLSPLTIPTIVAQINQAAQGGSFFQGCKKQFVAVGWMVPPGGVTDSGHRDDDGFCYFWGPDRSQLNAADHGQPWSDSFTIGVCEAPCFTQVPNYPDVEIVESTPEDPTAPMTFNVTLPADWFFIDLGAGLNLGPIDLTITLELDPSSCAGQSTRFDVPPSEIGPCWIELNGTSDANGLSCTCCNPVVQCTAAHPTAGFGEIGNGVYFVTSGITNSGACGGCTGVGITALSACLNRAWTLPVDYYGYSGVNPITPCTIPHVFVCYGNTSTPLGACGSFRYESKAVFVVTFPPNGGGSTVGMSLTLYVKEYSCSGSTQNTICEASANYTASIAIDQLACNGPWDVTLNTTSGCTMSWPSTISVSRTAAYPYTPPYGGACCNPTSTETYDCVGTPGSGTCTAHGGPGGTYTDYGACIAAHCQAPAVSYRCVNSLPGGCQDPGDGSGPFATHQLCLDSGCESGEAPIGDDSCCSDPENLPPNLTVVVDPQVACECMAVSIGLERNNVRRTWQVGYNTPCLNQTAFIEFYCLNGLNVLHFQCGDFDVVVTDADVDIPLCAPLGPQLRFGINVPACACCPTGGRIEVDILPSGGGA